MGIVDPKLVKKESKTLHRYILSLGQDIIFMAAREKCRPPKHIGLSQALHQKKQSRESVRKRYSELTYVGKKYSYLVMDSSSHKLWFTVK